MPRRVCQARHVTIDKHIVEDRYNARGLSNVREVLFGIKKKTIPGQALDCWKAWYGSKVECGKIGRMLDIHQMRGFLPGDKWANQYLQIYIMPLEVLSFRLQCFTFSSNGWIIWTSSNLGFLSTTAAATLTAMAVAAAMILHRALWYRFQFEAGFECWLPL